MSEHIGVLVEWNDERGFGFIEHESGQRIFVHISAVRASRRPVVGDTVGFNVQQDENGRLNAGYMRMQDPLINGEGTQWVKPKTTSKKQGDTQKKPLILSSYFAMVAMFLVLLGAWKVFVQYDFAWVMVVYGLASLISFVMYRADKQAAQNSQRRMPEKNLHMVELLGGWPGAAVAQVVFRHKSRKIQYQQFFVAIIFIHSVLWLDYLLNWAITQNLVVPAFDEIGAAVTWIIKNVLAGLNDWLN